MFLYKLFLQSQTSLCGEGADFHWSPFILLVLGLCWPSETASWRHRWLRRRSSALTWFLCWSEPIAFWTGTPKSSCMYVLNHLVSNLWWLWMGCSFLSCQSISCLGLLFLLSSVFLSIIVLFSYTLSWSKYDSLSLVIASWESSSWFYLELAYLSFGQSMASAKRSSKTIFQRMQLSSCQLSSMFSFCIHT